MRKATSLLFFTCMLVIALLIAGCPQEPEDGDNKTYTLYSEAAMDGSIVWSGGDDYTASTSDVSINIGDYDDGVVIVETTTRGFISFDLGLIPASAQIISAELRVYQNSDSSGNSYAVPPTGLGNVTAGVASYTVFNSGTAIVNGNWNAASIGALATSYSANTWHTLDVTTYLNDELTIYQTGRLQFIIRHEQENNNSGPPADTDGWVMGDSLINRPELIIITN